LIPAAEELDVSPVSESGTLTPELDGSIASSGLQASRVFTIENRSLNHAP